MFNNVTTYQYTADFEVFHLLHHQSEYPLWETVQPANEKRKCLLEITLPVYLANIV